MDITKSAIKTKANKYINGETVAYSYMFMALFLLFIVLKQILKLGFSVSSNIAILSSFIFCGIISYFIEKKLLFTHKVKNSTPKQIIFYIIGLCVDFGFFMLFRFILEDVLSLKNHTVYFLTSIVIFVFKYVFDRIIVFDSRSKAINNVNGKSYQLFCKNKYVFISIGIATISLMCIFLIFEMFPFGDTTVLRMDLYHQYGPLFSELYDNIINFKSFIYSWKSGGGSCFLGNYFNYLSSPLSVIIFLFDKKQIGYAITTIVVIKGLLSAGTFTYFINKSLNSYSIISSIFGVFYAFSGYYLAYYWNIMWLDGIILLPIIALGIERIINNGKPILYISSLAILFYANYYIAFMTCIFSILYFVIYYFVNYNGNDLINSKIKFGKKQFFKKLYNYRFVNRGLNFAFSSIICAAICACFLVPVYFLLQQCSATSESFPSTFTSYFNLIDLFTSHMAGLECTIRSSGDDVLPNIYCGVMAMILVPLYAINRNIRIKEKVAYLLLLVFFVFSFDNNVMNFIWHAFHFPNDLPYRFSYMYCFIILIISFKSLKNFKGIRYQDIGIVGAFCLFIVMYYQANPTNKINELTIYINIAFILAWTAILMLARKGAAKRFVVSAIILAITFCEVIVADSKSYVFTQHQEDYVADFDDYTEAIDYTYDKDKDFYRTELCYLNTRMDPCLYGYNGISTFSSMAYQKYSQTQHSLGMFGNRVNSYTYNNQTPVYNMMFAIKYLMHKETGVAPSNQYYSHFYSTKNYNTEVYKNEYYLPIAFEASNELENWTVQEGDPFVAQEDFIDLAAGVKNVFLPVQYLSTESYDVDCEDVIGNGTYTFNKSTDENSGGSFDVKISPVNNSNVYVYLTSSEIENVNYYWDNDETIFQNINEPYIMDLGYHKKGEEITISFSCDDIGATTSNFDIYAYSVDNDVLNSAYEMLKADQITITKYNATTIEGTIDAKYDGYLYSSIPYDEAWTVYIDGQKQKTFEIGDALLTTTLKKGKHTIKYKYVPKGIDYGAIISGATWCCIIAYFIIRKIFSKKEE